MIKINSKAECMLNIGEIRAFNDAGIITCFGLGSCVGLFLYDRLHKVGGGAHIMLPKFLGLEEENKISMSGYADHAVGALMTQMKIKGGQADGLGLRAKLVGGAHLFEGDHLQVGKKNIVAVLAELLQRRVYIASMDVGGSVYRTARFDTSNGMVEVTTPFKKYTI